MKKRRFIKDNKGMSLVELIIVIAIIAVLTTVSMVTMTIMHGAKAKDASMSFESRIAELQSKQRGQIVVCKTSESDDTLIQQNDYRYATKLYVIGEKAYVMDSIAIKNNPSAEADYNDDLIDEKINDGLGTCLSQYVEVIYYDADGNKKELKNGDCVYVCFDKSGACISGDGRYDFIKKSSGNVISSVTINKNGSIQMK